MKYHQPKSSHPGTCKGCTLDVELWGTPVKETKITHTVINSIIPEQAGEEVTYEGFRPYDSYTFDPKNLLVGVSYEGHTSFWEVENLKKNLDTLIREIYGDWDLTHVKVFSFEDNLPLLKQPEEVPPVDPEEEHKRFFNVQ